METFKKSKTLLILIVVFCLSRSSLTAQIQQSTAQDPAEAVEIIIEFTDPPLFALQPQIPDRALKAASLRSRSALLAADLQRIHAAVQGRSPAALPPVEINQSFYKIFAGASVTVPRTMLGHIQHLDYVKKVHFDREVEADLTESVPLIRADQVHTQFGVRGEGVVVGIIDTGIDYTHPALGGGLGVGFKVIGGYDLVNGDEDPMDDSSVSHGTHVAGIVAANGNGVLGVAPAATLMAFKVLGSNGQGRESWVIAGIERAVDPNDDGDFSDKVDIVNMSLGSRGGSSDDAQSQAVDNAVALGVTFCISAGNREEYLSVGSPGTARRAITVGASDKSDKMANFSSKGPAFGSFAVKPEVVAPGVNILSTAIGSGTRQLTGTSMSTPHVTGVCALLKNLHPDWSPEQLKAALVTSAFDLGEEALVQGAGRIDALDAARLTTLVLPSQLNFGFNDGRQSVWQKSDTLHIQNLSNTTQSYSISLSGLRFGVALQAVPSSFSLSAGQQQEIIVTLTVENSRVPDRPFGSSLSYSGFISIQGIIDQLRLPWSFAKTLRLRLVSDAPAFYILTTANMPVDPSTVVKVDPMTQDFYALPRGIYFLYTALLNPGYMPPKVIMKENLSIQSSQTIEINAAEAKHAIVLTGVNEQGDQLSGLPNAATNYTSSLRLAAPEIPTLTFGFSTQPLYSGSIFVSDISNRFLVFAVETYHDLGAANQMYTVQHPPLHGIDRDVTLSNQPASFVSRAVEVFYPPVVVNPAIHVMRTWGLFDENGEQARLGQDTGVLALTQRRWQGTIYTMPRVAPRYGAATTVQATLDTTRLVRQDLPYLISEVLQVVDGRVASFNTAEKSAVTYNPPENAPLRFGLTPIYPDLSNRYIDREFIGFTPQFRGPLNEQRYGDLLNTTFALYDASNQLLTSGRMYYDTNAQIMFQRSVAAGNYRLEFENSGFLAESDRPSKNTVILHLNTNSAGEGIPEFTSLQLFDANGLLVSGIPPREALELRFSAGDFSGFLKIMPIIENVTVLRAKPHGKDIWQEVALTIVHRDFTPAQQSGHRPIGTVYSADLSAFTQQDSSDIDLKIEIKDRSDNLVEWVMSPAFVVGNVVTAVDEDSQGRDAPGAPLQYALFQNYPNPFNPETTLKYQLSAASEVELVIYDLHGQEILTVFKGTQQAGLHSLTWDGKNKLGFSVASGVYFYRLVTPVGSRTLKAVKLD